MDTRRQFLSRAALASAALAALPLAACAQDRSERPRSEPTGAIAGYVPLGGALIARAIPSTGEMIPAIGVGTSGSYEVAIGSPEFIALARLHGFATVFTDSPDYPSFADVTADFVYARLMRSRSEIASGYPADELDAWARRVRAWASGSEPGDLPKIVDATPPARPRDVFIQFISAAKERNPAAAMALQAILARG